MRATSSVLSASVFFLFSGVMSILVLTLRASTSPALTVWFLSGEDIFLSISTISSIIFSIRSSFASICLISSTPSR